MTVILGGLAVSFAIWGIGDIFRGFGAADLAKVGDVEIGTEQFREIYSERLQRIGRQMGRPVTMEQARVNGLDQQILGEVIAQTALDQRAHQLGLAVSDEEVARQIMADPGFQGSSGRFDRSLFEALIRQGGYTESRFVGEQRQDMLRRQLLNTIAGSLVVPKTAVEAVYVHANEERSAQYVLLSAAQAGDIPPPSADVLAKYFDEHKELFRAPEYRKLTLVSVSPESIAKTINVPDPDAKRIFDEHRARYNKPERRHIEQIVFPSAEEAQAAADRIAKGLSFDALAKERGLQPKDIDLGTVGKNDMVDQAIADAAFSLAAGATSAPVKGRFGTALIHVVKIEAGENRSYEQVAETIKHDLALERARTQMSELRNKLEDNRAAGDTLAEAAQKVGLKATTVEAIDRSGRAPDGKPVSDLPKAAELVSNTFASEVGVETDPLQIEGGGYVWYDVAGITPSRERTLDEVKSQVEARWRNDEVTKRLQEKADVMVKSLNSGKTINEIAGAADLVPQTAAGLKRNNPTDVFSRNAIDAVFHTPKDQANTAPGAQPTQRVVFRVTDVKVPKLDMNSDAAKRIEEALRSSKSAELVGQYVAHLEDDIGVSVNQAALRQVTGGDTN